jgi:hypothetical protein
LREYDGGSCGVPLTQAARRELPVEERISVYRKTLAAVLLAAVAVVGAAASATAEVAVRKPAAAVEPPPPPQVPPIKVPDLPGPMKLVSDLLN